MFREDIKRKFDTQMMAQWSMGGCHPRRFLWPAWIQLSYLLWPSYWPYFMQNFETETSWGPLFTTLFSVSIYTISPFNQKLHYFTKFRLQQNCNYNFQKVFFKTNNNLKKFFSSILAACQLKIRDDTLLFSFCMSPEHERGPSLFQASQIFNLLTAW